MPDFRFLDLVTYEGRHGVVVAAATLKGEAQAQVKFAGASSYEWIDAKLLEKDAG